MSADVHQLDEHRRRRRAECMAAHPAGRRIVVDRDPAPVGGCWPVMAALVVVLGFLVFCWVAILAGLLAVWP